MPTVFETQKEKDLKVQPSVIKVLENHFGEGKVLIADENLDCNYSTDYVVDRKPINPIPLGAVMLCEGYSGTNVACRIREQKALKDYPWQINFRTDSGSPTLHQKNQNTEFKKIFQQERADLMIFGYASEDWTKVTDYTIINLKKLREYFWSNCHENFKWHAIDNSWKNPQDTSKFICVELLPLAMHNYKDRKVNFQDLRTDEYLLLYSDIQDLETSEVLYRTYEIDVNTVKYLKERKK